MIFSVHFNIIYKFLEEDMNNKFWNKNCYPLTLTLSVRRGEGILAKGAKGEGAISDSFFIDGRRSG